MSIDSTHCDINSCAVGETRSSQNTPLLRTFELFEPLRLFLKTNLEGSKGSKNLERAWILDAQYLMSLYIVAFRSHQGYILPTTPRTNIAPTSSTEAAVDITAFHELMQDKYAKEQERQSRRDHWLRILILCGMAPMALLLSFVLTYLWYSRR